MVIDLNVLNEGMLYSSKENHISIHCDPDTNRVEGFFMDPYIKVCDSDSWPKARNSVRIHLKDMGLNYSHSDSKGDLILNRKIINLLNSIMTIQVDANSRRTSFFDEKIKNGEPFTVHDSIVDYLVYRANDMRMKLIVLPSVFDFTRCYIRPGKEPSNGQRKKLDL